MQKRMGTTMIKGIDHIVIAVRDLNQAIQTYSNLGFTVVEGGKHPTGSYNALIGFQDGSYVELLAFYEESPDHPWWDLLHECGGGLIDFCMQTDDMPADYGKFKAQGVEMSEIVDLSRVRIDGYKLEWVNNKTYGQYQGLIPFVIEDKTPREERVPKEKDHVNGVTGIDTMTLGTNHLDLATSVMSAVLGNNGEKISRDDLGASGIRYQVGEHTLDYLKPDNNSSLLYAHVTGHNPIPYAVSFITEGEQQTFSLDQTEGVRLSLVSS